MASNLATRLTGQPEVAVFVDAVKQLQKPKLLSHEPDVPTFLSSLGLVREILADFCLVFLGPEPISRHPNLGP